MDEQRKFLSDRLLSEELSVTYRLLSRALDLHVNHAKAALYEYHKYQNGLRANSVFATYLISGTKSQQLSEDTHSSQDDEGAGHDSPTMTITLVTEEKLQDVLAEYQQVDSIHVYSLSPHPQRDMALLSDVSKSIPEYTGKHDGKVDEVRKIYGSILNPGARRKERKGGPPIPPSSSAPKPLAARPLQAEPSAAPPKATQAGGRVKHETAEASSNGSTPSSSGGKKPVASLKRGESASIMQSFARAAARPPSQAKPAAKRKQEEKEEDEDTAMAMSDDGEADDSDLLATSTNKLSSDAEAAIKMSRKEREMELRRMMEEDDDEDEDEDEEEQEAKEEAEEEDEEMAEAQDLEAEPEAEPEPEPTVAEKPSEIVSASSNGRRRGKRRVMKKKRILDDKGYMVTIQEEGWESFSEDEPPPPAPAPKPSIHTSTSTPASSGPKAKKSGAKGGAGQGSIMSFFTKK